VRRPARIDNSSPARERRDAKSNRVFAEPAANILIVNPIGTSTAASKVPMRQAAGAKI
jgi:hypothetical protein